MPSPASARTGAAVTSPAPSVTGTLMNGLLLTLANATRPGTEGRLRRSTLPGYPSG
jgi:hypothetical protein